MLVRGYFPLSFSLGLTLSFLILLSPPFTQGGKKFMEKNAIKKFQVIVRCHDMCPWCNRRGILASAMKKSVMRVCASGCGYIACTPKELLSLKEKVKFYDPKRYKGKRSGKYKKQLFVQFNACVVAARRRPRNEHYSRVFKEESKKGWLERLKSGTVSLPKDTGASRRPISSTSSLTQSNQ
jgi:hypothetical protein